MGFVDGKQADRHTVEHVLETGGGEPLGRDVKQLEYAGAQLVADLAGFVGAEQELSAAAATPAWRRASTWSRIKAISGETTTATPVRHNAGT